MILTLPASAYGECLLSSHYFTSVVAGEGGFLSIVVGITFYGIVFGVILTWGPTAI